MPDRPSRSGAAAIDMAAVRDLVDEKRRAMSAAEWAKATEDGAKVARELRALKSLPNPQAAMPAFRRKTASVGVAESAIASIPLNWDPRLADALIAAHAEIRKLPGREDASADGADEDRPDWMRERYGDPAEWRVQIIEIENGEGEKHVRLGDAERMRNDWQRYVFALGEKSASGSALTAEEAETLRRERERKTRLGARPVNDPGQNVDATGNPYVVAASYPGAESAWNRNGTAKIAANAHNGNRIQLAHDFQTKPESPQSGAPSEWWREDVKLDAQGNPEPTPPGQPILRRFTLTTQPEADLPGDLWTRLDEREIPKDWRKAIAAKEVESEPHGGYGTSATEVKVDEQGRTTVTVALGRYQMTRTALRDIGMLDEYQQWTGKYGVHSKREFLTNSDAQEAALMDVTARIERQLKSKGHTADNHKGDVVTGLLGGKIPITRSGLVAAAHGQGAARVDWYLRRLEQNNWYSRQAIPIVPEDADKFRSIELRLRVFQDVPYE